MSIEESSELASRSEVDISIQAFNHEDQKKLVELLESNQIDLDLKMKSSNRVQASFRLADIVSALSGNNSNSQASINKTSSMDESKDPSTERNKEENAPWTHREEDNHEIIDRLQEIVNSRITGKENSTITKKPISKGVRQVSTIPITTINNYWKEGGNKENKQNVANSTNGASASLKNQRKKAACKALQASKRDAKGILSVGQDESIQMSFKRALFGIETHKSEASIHQEDTMSQIQLEHQNEKREHQEDSSRGSVREFEGESSCREADKASDSSKEQEETQVEALLENFQEQPSLKRKKELQKDTKKTQKKSVSHFRFEPNKGEAPSTQEILRINWDEAESDSEKVQSNEESSGMPEPQDESPIPEKAPKKPRSSLNKKEVSKERKPRSKSKGKNEKKAKKSKKPKKTSRSASTSQPKKQKKMKEKPKKSKSKSKSPSRSPAPRSRSRSKSQINQENKKSKKTGRESQSRSRSPLKPKKEKGPQKTREASKKSLPKSSVTPQKKVERPIPQNNGNRGASPINLKGKSRQQIVSETLRSLRRTSVSPFKQKASLSRLKEPKQKTIQANAFGSLVDSVKGVHVKKNFKVTKDSSSSSDSDDSNQKAQNTKPTKSALKGKVSTRERKKSQPKPEKRVQIYDNSFKIMETPKSTVSNEEEDQETQFFRFQNELVDSMERQHKKNEKPNEQEVSPEVLIEKQLTFSLSQPPINENLPSFLEKYPCFKRKLAEVDAVSHFLKRPEKITQSSQLH